MILSNNSFDVVEASIKKILKVMVGNTIEISAKAFYNIDNDFPGKSMNIAPIIGAVLAGMTNPVSTVGESSQLANNPGTTSSNSTILSNLPEENNQNKTVQPQSGINFVLYNNEFDVVEANTGYLPVDDKINAIQVLATDKLVMTEAGFIEIFVNNEAVTPVYYDNMMVVMSSGSAMEVNAYYPYGMMITNLSVTALPAKYNAYKYSAKELQEMTGFHDFGNRMQDPVKGRFTTPDRFAEKYYHLSPYQYAANNPINFIDINGDSIWIYYDGGRELYTAGMKYGGHNSYVSLVVDALNKIANGKFGGYMIGELQNSEFGFNISQGKMNENYANANFNDPNMRYDGGIYYTGANITWDGNKTITLGHEMAHGWDAMNGYDLNLNNWDTFFNIPEREVRAVHMENILRVEQNMPLRYQYGDQRALVNPMGIEVREKYDYKNGTNVPWNYGNGKYGTCRTSIPYAPSVPLKKIPTPIPQPLKMQGR